MRTVNSTLTAALHSGAPLNLCRGFIGLADGTIQVGPVQVYYYKLTGTTLEMLVRTHSGANSEAIWLERGLSLAGTEYTLTTGRFFTLTQARLPGGMQRLTGSILPPQFYEADGYDTYENVIGALCTNFGKTAVFRDDTEAWLGYKFFPSGSMLRLTDANLLAPLLRQKRLISYCDNGGEEILFYSADVIGTPDDTLDLDDDYELIQSTVKARQYIWRDDAGTDHQDGDTADRVHNLGYLESTDSPPARNTAAAQFRAVVRPDLRYLDGDVLKFRIDGGSVTVTALAQVTEIYDPEGGHPRWRMLIDSNPIFDNSEGGALPSTVERSGNYQQLNTSRFNHLLSERDSNIQRAMDTLDATVLRQLLFTSGQSGQVAAGGTNYVNFANFGLNAAASNIAIPVACTLRNLSVKTQSAQPGSGSLVCTVQKNNVNTALAVTFASGAAAQTKVDSTSEVSLAANDFITLACVNNAAAASAKIARITLELRF